MHDKLSEALQNIVQDCAIGSIIYLLIFPNKSVHAKLFAGSVKSKINRADNVILNQDG